MPADRQRLLAAFAAHAGAILQRRALQRAAGEAAVLARDNSARTALLSAVSHDLRTPLAGIKAAIGSLRSSEVTFSPEDEAELEAAIEDSADRLDALIGNLLDMSRLQAGALVASPRPVDLGEVVPAAVAAVSEPDRVDWTLDPAARLVVADPGLLDRVLGNVVENALRHQPAPGRVRVSTSGLGGRTQVRVVDTGPGVPEDARERIFLPFQRYGDAPSGDGVGLGWRWPAGSPRRWAARCRRRRRPAEASRWSSSCRSAEEDRAMAERVLVVDDDETIRRTLRINLRARGYEVEVVGSGRDALSTVEDAPPDLVILDLGLPDLDGVEVLRRLRRTSRVPVVVLSARHQSDDKVEALDEGADDYVTKPFGMDELMARVRSALRRGGGTPRRSPASRRRRPTTSPSTSRTLTATRRGRAGAPHADRVAAARRARPAPGAGRDPGRPAAGGVGAGLRPRVELPAGLRQPAAPQARGRPRRPRHILTEPGIGYRLVE